MLDDIPYITAFLIGIISSMHCFSMCGSIAIILSLNIKKKNTHNVHIYQLFYNLGRIISYVIISFLINNLGIVLSDLFGEKAIIVLKIFSGFIFINLGLYFLEKFHILMYIEKAGFKFWILISPLIRNFLPIDNPIKGFLIGIFWGNLPCGLTYSVLLWTLGFHSVYQGMMLMMFFGLGTLPSMFITGFFAVKLQKIINNKIFKVISGYIIIVYGFLSIIITLYS